MPSLERGESREGLALRRVPRDLEADTVVVLPEQAPDAGFWKER